mgnify:CR=1 FL=1
MKYSLGRDNPFRYRSYYYDVETGLFYVGSRYYDPEIGRFLNADTTDILDGGNDHMLENNLFAYCFNNPVNNYDPSGCWPKWIGTALKVAAIVVVTAVVVAAVVVAAPAVAGAVAATAAFYGASAAVAGALATAVTIGCAAVATGVAVTGVNRAVEAATGTNYGEKGLCKVKMKE